MGRVVRHGSAAGPSCVVNSAMTTQTTHQTHPKGRALGKNSTQTTGVAAGAPEQDLDLAAPTADLVRLYLDDIGRTPLLTAAEEVELSQRIEAGVYAQHLLTAGGLGDGEDAARRRADLQALVREGEGAKDQMLRAN